MTQADMQTATPPRRASFTGDDPETREYIVEARQATPPRSTSPRIEDVTGAGENPEEESGAEAQGRVGTDQKGRCATRPMPAHKPMTV